MTVEECSPLTINLMLACRVSHSPEEFVGSRTWHSEAAKMARDWLYSEGLIDANNRATERGTSWVDHICATPLPVQVWVLPERVHA